MGAALERQKNKIKKDKVRMLKYKLLQTMSFTRQDMPAKPRAGVNIGVRGRSEDSQVLGVRRQSRKERWSLKVPPVMKLHDQLQAFFSKGEDLTQQRILSSRPEEKDPQSSNY